MAFIDIGNRKAGSAEFTALHEGVAYYFFSDANLQKLKQAADRYLPQFGGFCAYGASVGKKFDGDPRFAAVENGELYVFVSEAVFNALQQDRAGAIRKAEANWRKIRSKAASL